MACVDKHFSSFQPPCEVQNNFHFTKEEGFREVISCASFVSSRVMIQTQNMPTVAMTPYLLVQGPSVSFSAASPVIVLLQYIPFSLVSSLDSFILF